MLVLLLAGCGATDPVQPDAPDAGASPGSAVSEGATSGTSPTPTAGGQGSGQGSGRPRTPTPTPSPGPSTGTGSIDTEQQTTPELEPSAVRLGRLLAARRTVRLVPTQLPASASASGRLVDGVPAVLAPPRGAPVQSSSIATTPPHTQIAWVATTTLAPAVALRRYRRRLARTGAAETEAPPTGAGQSARFTLGSSVVTLVATPTGRSTTLTLVAVLHGRG